MKRLSYEEYQKRVEAVNKATRIFGVLTENNITKSFIAYQEILAEEDRAVFINAAIGGRRPKTMLDDEAQFKLPKCPECGREMRLQQLNTHPTNQVDGNYHTQWICSEWTKYKSGDSETLNLMECDYMDEYSEKSMTDWMNELTIKPEGKQCR